MKTRKEKGPNLFGNSNIISNLVNTVTGQTPTPAAAPPPPPPTPELETPSQETPAIDPQQVELRRQAKMVNSGNVNAAQADYFREQNEDLFTKGGLGGIREGGGKLKDAAQYNKLEKITGVNPVSNRKNDKMTELFGGLYGSEESRGF